MSNLKISQLPEYTGNTSGSFLVMNNSGETTTYKVKKENYVFPYNGNATITGSLRTSGSLDLEGIRFTITGSQIFAGQTIKLATGSANLQNYVWGTYPNFNANITPQSYESGVTLISLDNISGNVLNRVEIKKNSTEFALTDNTLISGATYYTQTFFSLPTNISGSNPPPQFKRSIGITGSVNISTAINLQKQDPLPTGITGSLAVSGSNLYFNNGTTWIQII